MQTDASSAIERKKRKGKQGRKTATHILRRPSQLTDVRIRELLPIR